ncbi:M18 family aminopeptidase [Simiduia curdlanivorans]|uniref:M18 family aminopeptidase n=1 Tax=Simiduia curdlanivorans TaxID=1492769 RepID=A0ABV8V829_9GAMM|nr:M18 family aminopeptidase [Simiduia curdlanivorans]MDN3639601.1 M18 family aminopeptidase [Simiduia curdlanivorans]
MSNLAVITKLIDFLKSSPTPFHAVDSMKKRLLSAGFCELKEGDAWQFEVGGKYFITRNNSSIIAYIHGKQIAEQGIHMVGAHTDSPCLKVKPNPVVNSQSYLQLGVEVYGGVLLAPWFDRDLSLAGRVNYLDSQGSRRSALVDFKKPIAIVPSLAIHLDREVNKSRSINPQTDIPPVLAQLASAEAGFDFKALLAGQLAAEGVADCASVLDYELSFYDTQPAALVGLQEQFFVGARLDNLLSCFVGLEAMLASGSDYAQILICNDHEEVGSLSACGAQGPMLRQFLERLIPDVELRNRVVDRSIMISADNAHGIHPNYADKHEQNHGPLLNKGPVIKVNANQRYATNSETSAYFRHLCQQVNAPVQAFVVRTDMACGSTIGPITAAEIGVKTLDVGMPTWGMHSIRETAGTTDMLDLIKVLQRHYSTR